VINRDLFNCTITAMLKASVRFGVIKVTRKSWQ